MRSRPAPSIVVAVCLLAPLACSSPPTAEAPAATQAPPSAATQAAPAPAAHVLEVGNAFLWEVSGGTLGDDRAYLLGSIHVLDVPMEFGPRLGALFDGADELMLEAHGDVDPMSLMDLTGYFGRFPPAGSLREHLKPDAYDRLERFYVEYPAPEPLIWDVEGTKPWLHLFWMLGAWLDRAGVQREWGTEALFERRAGERVPVVGLETFAEALEAMAAVPIEEQSAELTRMLDAWDGGGAEEAGLPELVDAWKRGDEAALLVAAQMPPGFTEFLLLRRNEVMASRMAERFGLGGTRFAVIGAAHFLGEDSILDRLRTRGFRIEPVR